MPLYVAVFALVLAYVALVAAYIALRTLAKVRRASTVLARGSRTESGYESLLELTGRHTEQTELLAEEVAGLKAEMARAAAGAAGAPGQHDTALRRLALVRYDAFADTSGRMSFSLAVLDELGNGVTVSALSGRSDTRMYAKSIAAGKGEQELSPEEHQAVRAALSDRHGERHVKSA